MNGAKGMRVSYQNCERGEKWGSSHGFDIEIVGGSSTVIFAVFCLDGVCPRGCIAFGGEIVSLLAVFITVNG